MFFSYFIIDQSMILMFRLAAMHDPWRDIDEAIKRAFENGH